MKKLFILLFYNKTGSPVKALPIFGETETVKAINDWADEQGLEEIENVTEEILYRCVVPTKVQRLDGAGKTVVIIFPQTERFTKNLIDGWGRSMPNTTL